MKIAPIGLILPTSPTYKPVSVNKMRVECYLHARRFFIQPSARSLDIARNAVIAAIIIGPPVLEDSSPATVPVVLRAILPDAVLSAGERHRCQNGSNFSPRDDIDCKRFVNTGRLASRNQSTEGHMRLPWLHRLPCNTRSAGGRTDRSD